MKKSAIASAFSNGNFELCFEYLTDHTTWNTPGTSFLNNKAEIVAFCRKTRCYFDSVTTDFKQLNVIESEQFVVINGTATFLEDGVQIHFVSSCDLYEFNDEDQIINITSYCIPE